MAEREYRAGGCDRVELHVESIEMLPTVEALLDGAVRRREHRQVVAYLTQMRDGLIALERPSLLTGKLPACSRPAREWC